MGSIFSGGSPMDTEPRDLEPRQCFVVVANGGNNDGFKVLGPLCGRAQQPLLSFRARGSRGRSSFGGSTIRLTAELMLPEPDILLADVLLVALLLLERVDAASLVDTASLVELTSLLSRESVPSITKAFNLSWSLPFFSRTHRKARCSFIASALSSLPLHV